MVDGQKYDTGKVRMELLPGDALFAIAQVLTFGAQKYASRNWEQGIAWGRVFGALMRHLWAWWQGKGPTNQSFLFGDLDEETKLSHLWHAGCCIVFLISYEMRGMTLYDDRPGRSTILGEETERAFANPPAKADKVPGGALGGCREQMDPVDTVTHRVDAWAYNVNPLFPKSSTSRLPPDPIAVPGAVQYNVDGNPLRTPTRNIEDELRGALYGPSSGVDQPSILGEAQLLYEAGTKQWDNCPGGCV